MNNENLGLEVLVAIVFILFFVAILTVFNTAVIFFGWNYFVAPVFHLGVITKLQAFIGGLLFGFIFNRPRLSIKK